MICIQPLYNLHSIGGESVSHYHAYHDNRVHRVNKALNLATSKEQEWALIHKQVESLRLYQVGGRSRR